MLKLKEIYQKEVIDKMKKEFGYKNTFEVPKIEKIVMNVGIGKSKEDPKIFDFITNGLMIITGQKPAATKAKKAIAGFKIRKGDKIGLKTTLRGQRMYDFLERLIRISLPRIRDFRGLKINGFDKKGNYNFGIKEHIIFAEIKYDKTEKFFGVQICIKTTAKNDKEAKELLTFLGFPFEKVIQQKSIKIESRKNG